MIPRWSDVIIYEWRGRANDDIFSSATTWIYSPKWRARSYVYGRQLSPRFWKNTKNKKERRWTDGTVLRRDPRRKNRARFTIRCFQFGNFNKNNNFISYVEEREDNRRTIPVRLYVLLAVLSFINATVLHKPIALSSYTLHAILLSCIQFYYPRNPIIHYARWLTGRNLFHQSLLFCLASVSIWSVVFGFARETNSEVSDSIDGLRGEREAGEREREKTNWIRT